MTRHVLDRGEGSSVVHVYEPPGLVGGARASVAVLFDGSTWMNLDVAATFDNLLADGLVGPMVAVVVESIRGAAPRGPTRIRSLTDPALFMPFLLEELVPFVAERWNVSADPAQTVLVGQSLGGLTAAHAALAAPESSAPCSASPRPIGGPAAPMGN